MALSEDVGSEGQAAGHGFTRCGTTRLHDFAARQTGVLPVPGQGDRSGPPKRLCGLHLFQCVEELARPRPALLRPTRERA